MQVGSQLIWIIAGVATLGVMVPRLHIRCNMAKIRMSGVRSENQEIIERVHRICKDPLRGQINGLHGAHHNASIRWVTQDGPDRPRHVGGR